MLVRGAKVPGDLLITSASPLVAEKILAHFRLQCLQAAKMSFFGRAQFQRMNYRYSGF
jgi:hypothetical protein